ncbi:hypothetical protein BKA62DRAFT_273562 [Auriculariales sp. MPI-PUGE-AT-0066]|nr:hypothetical protein BKA62DRAFT_273562 [Auriculariales sp. MPI-PUGE-AT-0066]
MSSRSSSTSPSSGTQPSASYPMSRSQQVKYRDYRARALWGRYAVASRDYTHRPPKAPNMTLAEKMEEELDERERHHGINQRITKWRAGQMQWTDMVEESPFSDDEDNTSEQDDSEVTESDSTGPLTASSAKSSMNDVPIVRPDAPQLRIFTNAHAFPRPSPTSYKKPTSPMVWFAGSNEAAHPAVQNGIDAVSEKSITPSPTTRGGKGAGLTNFRMACHARSDS